MSIRNSITLVLATFIASVLFGAKEDVNVTSVAVQNVIGVQQLVSELEYTPIAVCYGSTAVRANRPVNQGRHVTNLVFTANLQEGDQLFVYDHARQGYVTYVLNAGKAWVADTVFATSNKGKDLVPADNQSQPWGYGFWLYRKGIAKRADKRIYLAGQVPINEVSIELAPSTATTYGKTLVGNPLGAPWNLKDNSIINWSAVAKDGDHIQLNDDNATIYYWRKERGKSNYTWTSGKGTGVIPAGAAFWYVRALQKTKELAQEPIVIRFRTGL